MSHANASNDWKQWTVAITGMNCRPDNPGPGYPVARCLQDSQIFQGNIIGLGYDALDMGLHLGGISDNGYLLPYPSTGSDALWNRLTEILDENQIDAIIPCLDSELLNFMTIEDRLMERGVRLFIPDRAMFIGRNKDYLPELCDKIGVKTPPCSRVTDPSFFSRCVEDGHPFPLEIKGIFCEAYVAHNPDEACTYFNKIAAQWGYPVLVQPFIQGEEYNLVAIGDGHGNMIGAVSMCKRAITEKGKAWAGISTLDPELHDMSAKLVAALKWRGPLEIEVLRDKTGDIYLIEINPRFPAWIYLSHGVGRNLPIALLQLMAGDSEFDLRPISAGTLFIRYAQELIVDISELECLTMHGQAVLSDENSN
ncbi:MAG: ATP-grasp domain-containing protein [Legionellales bacterium]|nr:ATP-grasp domain-containing protein [Legionellales bacterium]